MNSSGPREAAGAPASSISVTSARGQEGNGGGARDRRRMRIKYSRGFLLAVGGSESCRRGKPLPAGMRASVLIMTGMQLWSINSTAATATKDQLQGEAATEGGDETAGAGDGTAAGSSDGEGEPDALQIGIRSKSKPCTEFFSTAGCRFGENCLFIHNLPVDYQTAADVRVPGSPAARAHPPGSIPTGPPVPDGQPTPTVKARPCNSAHNERELDKHMSMDNSTPPLKDEKTTGHYAAQPGCNPGMATPAGFKASATAKISVDTALTDAIIRRGRDNVKLISLGRGLESFQIGVGSKSKPCIKFFSTIGCPFGEGCHFLHHFPGGHLAVVNMSNLGGPTFAHPPPGIMPMRPAVPNGPSTSTVKSRLCRNYNTTEGCKWGDKCHFAHAETELGKHTFMDSSVPPHMGPRPTSHFAPPAMPNPGMFTPASFGASATAKISVDASLAGAIIGRGGMNTKLISQITGAKLGIRDHESDASMKNIELQGTFDQIKNAGTKVRELIVSFGVNTAPPPGRNSAGGSHLIGGVPRSSFKTKLCENFARGLCTYGDKCRFAHGENERRNLSAA